MNRLFKRAGFTVVRRSHPGARYLDHIPLNAFDSVLLREFTSLRGLRFIQVGANDGRRADPIHDLVIRHSWTGLLLEPLPANFRELRKTYAGRPGLTLLNAALDDKTGTRPIFSLAPSLVGRVPDWAWGLSSFDAARVRQAASELGLGSDAVVSEPIATVTWTEVWSRMPDGKCDLLVLDTEGFDVALLRTADLGQHRPRVIHFEHACVSSAERVAFYCELLDLGYELATDGPDTTALLRA